MEKYFEILEQIKKENLNMTKLYILSCLDLEDKEKTINQLNYIYKAWIDLDVDIDLSRLSDIVSEHWHEIEINQISEDEIVEMCLNY